MKIQTKVFLPGEIVRQLDDAARRMRKPKSEIVRAAVASYLSPDSSEASEAAITRRLDRQSRQIDRLERDVMISNEAIALFVRTWLRAQPPSVVRDDRASADLGRERWGQFIEALGRGIASGKLLRNEVSAEGRAPEDDFWRHGVFK